MEVKETQKPLCKVSMNKNSVKIILISIRNRKYCKEMPVADSVIQYVPLGGELTNVIKAHQETYHKLKIKSKELIHSQKMSKNCDTITTMYCMFKGNIISKN